MSGKSFAVGEGGIMLTNDELVHERAKVFGLYERAAELTIPELKSGAGLPWGGCKYRMHQLSAAVGRVRIRTYPEEMAQIDKAMNYYWDLLEDTPGVRAIRPSKDSGSTMGGWYYPVGRYVSEELGGLSITRFCEALRAEGAPGRPGCNKALHHHPLFSSIDVYGDGKPTRIANSTGDLANLQEPLPVTESIQKKVFSSPAFKHYRPEIIDEYAAAVKKVAANYEDLLPGDTGDTGAIGGWALSINVG
jgi:perosamine synthetase